MTRQALWLFIKVAVAGLLVGWLVRSGTLDFHALSVFFDRPALLVANVAMFAVTTVLGGLRWRLLLQLADVRLSVGRAIRLAFIAAFFNVVAPGNIGGDVVKSIYVARDATPERRTSVFVIAFLDRFLALAGLVAVAAVLTTARGKAVWIDPRFRQLSIAVAALVVATLVAPILVMWLIRRSGTRLDRWTGGTTRIGRLFGQLVASARLVSGGPRTLLAAFGLAIATHVAGIVWFCALASAVTAQDIHVATMASVYPLGILTMMLPISYAGFGVGHVAFDQLFAMVGLTGGATVLNVYLIGQTVPCLFAVIPYLTLKREAPALRDPSGLDSTPASRM
jgi:uncharacterized membrane protein YbhN (UPF0104 family)